MGIDLVIPPKGFHYSKVLAHMVKDVYAIMFVINKKEHELFYIFTEELPIVVCFFL